MKTAELLLITLLMLAACGTGEPMPELGFEMPDSTGTEPEGWYIYGQTYDEGGSSLELDTLNIHSGRYSLKMFQGTATFVLPAGYRGDSLELRAWMLTESGPATNSRGFWINTEDSGGELHSLYTENEAVQADSLWHEYSLKIPLHPYAREIVFGAFIYGDGTAWIDDLEIYADGKPLWSMRKGEPRDYPADADSVFYGSSGIRVGEADEQQLESLALTGKVWGFIKYYHPLVAQGNINMDAELFRLLPRVLETGDIEETEDMLADWIGGMGRLPGCDDCPVEIEGDYRLLPDLDWLSAGIVGERLSRVLTEVLRNRNTGPNYYISLNPGVGNPVFKHENPYRDPGYPDEGYRLLGLFRYWNMIQYFYPYKEIIGMDWNEVLPEFIPVFLDASDALEYRLAALRLIGRINDTHANIWGNDSILNDYFGRYYAPVQVKFIEEKAVVTGYYDKKRGRWSGLRPGDIILSVDGDEVPAMVEQRMDYYPASNRPTKLRDIAKNLMRGKTSTVRVEYERSGKKDTLKLSRYPAERLDLSADWSRSQPDSCYRLINSRVGYINLGNIRTSMLADIFTLFRDTRGIIIDIRNYPAEFVVFSLGKYLMPEPVEFVKFTRPVTSYPGLFEWQDPPSVGEHNPDYYKGRVVILVNEITQSQAEYTTMALRQAPRAIVLGSTTAGSDGNVSRVFFPGYIFTMISGIGVYFPDGSETQRIGMVPDVEKRPTVSGIRAGRDEILEKAMELIENGDIDRKW